ncbi:uncharacterized protein LOC144180184 [Haemaphysalis longicornis]
MLLQAAAMEESTVAALKMRIAQLGAENSRLKASNKQLQDSICSSELQELRSMNRELQKALCRKVLFAGSEESGDGLQHHTNMEPAVEPAAPTISYTSMGSAAAPAISCASTGLGALLPPAISRATTSPGALPPPGSSCTSAGPGALPPSGSTCASTDSAAPSPGTSCSNMSPGSLPSPASTGPVALPTTSCASAGLAEAPPPALDTGCEETLRQAALIPDTTAGTVSDGQVHLGRGIYIDLGTWERLLLLPTDAAFCKQLAVRMWGNDVLKVRSLNGTLSNTAISKGGLKAHKALSPVKVAALSDSFWHYLQVKLCDPAEMEKRHKLLARYLAQKCADLRR